MLDRYRTAIIAGDGGALDELLEDDYQFISARARVVDREHRLTALVAGHEHLADLTFSCVDIRLIDGIALVRARCTTNTTATIPDPNAHRGAGQAVGQTHSIRHVRTATGPARR
jgi:hypothetical protein